MSAVIAKYENTLADKIQKEFDDFLRIPFYIDLSSSGRLEDENEVRVPDDMVKEVIDNFIELHMPEIEARLHMLARVRRLRGDL